MRKKIRFLIYPLLIVGILLVFGSSCNKDDDNIVLPTTTVTDARDGKVYKIVSIGTQVWMAENLAYLPSVVGLGTSSNTTPYYYVYGYDGTSVTAAKSSINYTTYGVLYNWPAAMAGSSSSSANPSGVQGVCPTGWHLPSYSEWTQLTDYLGGSTVAGGKLKSTGTIEAVTGLWYAPNTGATNETGFTALPGGSSGGNMGYVGHWWSSTEYSSILALHCFLYYSLNDVSIYDNFYKQNNFSVRCIKD